MTQLHRKLHRFPVAPSRCTMYTPLLGQSSVIACGPSGARR